MLAAASAWSAVAADLNNAAMSYGSVISALADGSWVGPSSATMAEAVAPYVEWMSATGGQAEVAAAQAQAAAAAYESAFSMTVPPPVIAENRAQLMMLTATNYFNQNATAIAATEAEYAEMWAQDAAAMYGYAANSAAATAQVSQFTAAPPTTNAAGVAAQGAAGSQAAGTSIGSVQSALSGFISNISNSLQSLASPLGSAVSGVPNSLGGSLGLSSAQIQGVESSLIAEYGYLPGFFALMMTSNALGPLMNPDVFLPFMNMAGGAPGAAAAAAAPAALGAEFAGGMGGLAGAGLGGAASLGQAASLGALSVPASWGWAAAGPAAMLGGMPMAAPIAAVDPYIAGGLGLPFMPMALPAGAAAASAAGKGGKYGLPLAAVMTRPPAAGYGPSRNGVQPAAAYPVPAGFPTNGHAPPGYQPAIVYVPMPNNANKSSKV
ncbi:hypothetical protein MPRM_54670 [Mycobacterium parmense]|uniref:PPE family protein n=3 Tax=Mycobacteriaceae TaxID=1762 RepID=A0A7I7Z271_9MYCO|nr:hypothetical protein MPRM_54670 [Mycobacterium parmense]